MATRRGIVAWAAVALAVMATCAPTAVQAQASVVRGIKQRDLARYTSDLFTCFDNSNTIAPDQINDDYCDCTDGSDEPGTSACVNSVFWCANRGAKGQLLPSSRVRDGVCDCCDGTDEVRQDGTSPCANTCEESGRAAREALQAQLAQTEAGLLARATLLASASETIATRQAKIAKYTSLLAVRQAKLDAAKEIKEREEAIENEERAKRQAEADAKRAVEDAAAAAADPTGQAAAPPADAAAGTPPADAAVTGAAPPTDAAAAAAPATPEAPKENFPFPPEYAYQQADDADKPAHGDAAAPAKENFPFPPEYAAPQGDAPVPLEGGVGNVDDDTIEPEYIEGEEDDGPDGDDDDDDDREDDEHPHAQEGEAGHEGTYVHPGGVATKAAVQANTETAARSISAPSTTAASATPTSTTPSASEQFLASATSTFHSVLASINSSPLLTSEYWLATGLAHSEYVVSSAQSLVTTVKEMATLRYNWSAGLTRVQASALRFFVWLGDSIVALVEALEWRLFGTTRFEDWIEYMEGGDAGKTTAKKTAVPPPPPPPVARNGVPLYVHPAAETARAEYDAIHSKLTRLSKKLEDLQKLADRDYGADDQFAPWDGKCFELQVKQYTYEVCPYGSAKQKEGHSSTSLGSWSGFDDVDRTHLKFTGGQTCWQGPQRSLTVKLRCGEADTLLTVDEPSKCVYEMTMQTPAVCQEAHVHAIRQTLEGKPVHEHDEL